MRLEIPTWEDMLGMLKLAEPVLREAARLGYRRLTRVQEKAIPYVLTGSNVLIIAPTGSGKTEAAMFPVFSMMLEEVGRGGRGVLAIYVTPLRALNRDILRRMRTLASRLGFSVAVRHGDTPRSERRRIAENPPHILITTPETLQFILTIPALRPRLRRLRWVIVDELHELLDDERGCELAVALERLEDVSSRRIQRIGLSATIGDEEEAKRLLGGVGRRVYVVRVEEEKQVRIRVEVPPAGEADEELASKIGLRAEAVARARRIAELVRGRRATLLFTNTRDFAEAIASRLKTIGYDSFRVHHGSLSRGERVEAEEEFKRGLLPLIIATSSLELGIDVGHADLVIQYMSPRQAVKLLQRVGRSGHWIEKVSEGIIVAGGLVDDVLESAVIARRAMSGDLERARVHESPLDVLAHQIVGMVLERRSITPHQIFSVVKRAYPFRNLDFEEFLRVLDYLSSIGYVRTRPDGTLRPGYGSIKYYYETSMIPDTKRYTVVDMSSNRSVGSLDEEFVASACEVGFKFVLSGRVWRIVGIDEDEHKVMVEPSSDVVGAVPAWVGELIPVEFEVAREAASILRRLEEGKDPLHLYPVDREGHKIIRETVEELKRRGIPVPHDRRVLVENLGNTVVIHMPLGSRGTAALSYVLSYVLSRSYNMSASTTSDPYRVAVSTPRPIPEGLIPSILRELTSKDTVDTLRRALRESRAYRWRVIQVAKKFGALPRDSPSRLPSRIVEALAETPIGDEALRELIHDRFDPEPLIRYLELIRAGRVEVVEVRLDKPTPLAQNILLNFTVREALAPTLPRHLVVELVKRRLLSKHVKLVCLMCGRWERTERVGSLPDRIRCSRCGSAFIAPTHPLDERLREAVRRFYSGKRLTREDRELLRRAREMADLVLRYGKPAVIALSAYGIGPKTAARIVSRFRLGEDLFYTSIFEAEKEYVRTRPYWDS